MHGTKRGTRSVNDDDRGERGCRTGGQQRVECGWEEILASTRQDISRIYSSFVSNSTKNILSYTWPACAYVDACAIVMSFSRPTDRWCHTVHIYIIVYICMFQGWTTRISPVPRNEPAEHGQMPEGGARGQQTVTLPSFMGCVSHCMHICLVQTLKDMYIFNFIKQGYVHIFIKGVYIFS